MFEYLMKSDGTIKYGNNDNDYDNDTRNYDDHDNGNDHNT